MGCCEADAYNVLLDAEAYDERNGMGLAAVRKPLNQEKPMDNRTNKLPADQPVALLSDAQVEELETLVAPLAVDDPSGPSLRFDPIFTEIRLAREEDDPSLPMGVWERTLKRADWAMIAQRCSITLTRQSKDLQIAGWLTEAWMRQTGVEGLFRGLLVVERLLTDFWGSVHPRLDDDGDADMRVAPLEWMNASLASTLRFSVPLLPPADRLPPELSLGEWERMTMRELARTPPGAASESPESADILDTRGDIAAHVAANLGGAVARRLRLVRACLSTLLSIDTFIDARLGAEAPNMSRLRDTLHAMERVLLQMAPSDRGEPTPQHGMPQVPDAKAGLPPPAQSNWASRDDAYATLEAIADYLARIEPHSPTPYLLRRAVNWGRMPLPELMAEIIREEGDLTRLGRLLGLSA